MAPSASDSTRRIQLILRKPAIGWYPKPTVVFDGRGQPAQWGNGTWQVSAERSTTIRIYLFNRLWRFGSAEVTVGADQPASLAYAAPLLPFVRGRLVAGD